MKKIGDITKYIRGNTLKIIVKPNSNKSEIIDFNDDKQAIRVNIKAKPEANKANVEVVKFFSRLLKKRVRIVSGLKIKEKIIRVELNG